MTQRRRHESFSAAFTREVGRMTVGIWGLTRLGNTRWKLLTVPAAVLVLAVIYVTLALLVLATFTGSPDHLLRDRGHRAADPARPGLPAAQVVLAGGGLRAPLAPSLRGKEG